MFSFIFEQKQGYYITSYEVLKYGRLKNPTFSLILRCIDFSNAHLLLINLDLATFQDNEYLFLQLEIQGHPGFCDAS